MYSIALNRVYLHRIINILAVVTNRQFPWSCFQRHTPLSPADSERVCLCCSWCLVRAYDTRMVIFWGGLTGLNNPSSLHQPVETFCPVCQIYPLNHLLKIPPGTSVSKKRVTYFYREVQAVIKVFWCSQFWLALSPPCESCVLWRFSWDRFARLRDKISSWL